MFILEDTGDFVPFVDRLESVPDLDLLFERIFFLWIFHFGEFAVLVDQGFSHKFFGGLRVGQEVCTGEIDHEGRRPDFLPREELYSFFDSADGFTGEDKIP